MRHFNFLALALTFAAVVTLAPTARAQGADLQGRWTDSNGAYLITVGEGVQVNPPAGGGAGAWIEYNATVTYADGSALMTDDGQLVDFTITAQFHGNQAIGFKVETVYAIKVDGFVVDSGGGQLNLSSDQGTLDGYWKDADGSTGRLTLLRVPADPGNAAP